MKIGQLKYSLLLFIIALCSCNQIPVNWSPTFDSTDKIPYGTYILRKEMKELFPNSKIENIKNYTFNYFEENKYGNKESTYFLIYPGNYHDNYTWQLILNYVNRGGSAFVSIRHDDPVLQEHLGLIFGEIEIAEENIAVKLSVLNDGKETTNILQKGVSTTFIENYDPETTEILGYFEYKNVKEPNFVKVYHGKGYFLVHTEPYAFTNYHLLRDDNYKYATDVLSYVEDQPLILWDNHNMYFRDTLKYDNGGFFSALSFIFKHESLLSAFLLLVFMGFLYLIFNAKRKQSAVKIIEPYSNNTLNFAQTLAELYKSNADHTAITKYKINYFLEQIKQNYNISTKETEKDFSELLSAKSGVDLNLCKKLVLTMDIFRSRNYLDKEDFFKLQSLIQSFNQKSDHYGRANQRK